MRKYVETAVRSVKNIRKVPAKPIAVTCMVTQVCNSRCRMCGIWKSASKKTAEQELSLSDIKRNFSSDFFSELSTISLSGGEPFLRRDLADIVETIARSCKNIKNIVIPTNGFATALTLSATEEMLGRIDKKINLAVSVSIDGIGTVHDYTRGVPNAYKNAIATLKGLVKLSKKHRNLHPGFGSVILPWNINALEELVLLSKRLNLPLPQFWLPAIGEGHYNNAALEDNIQLSGTQLETALAFLRDYKYLLDFYAFYADNASRVLRRKEKIFYCYWGYNLLYFDAKGDVYPCLYLNDKKHLMGNMKLQDLSEIWHSKRSDTVRKMLGSEPACRYCIGSCRFFENIATNALPYAKWKVKKLAAF